jgi:hypothetical protein
MMLALLCLAPQMAFAAKPAAPPAENPAVDTTDGTTIVGERESDQGLYLTPWKEEHADDIDPPPGLLDIRPAAVDPRAFARQVRDAATLAAYRRELLQPNR